MDLIRQFAIQIPVLIVSLTLMIAAMLKAGREKGATLIMLGAVSMCVMSIATPLIYSVIVPKLIDNLGFDAYLAIGIAVNVLWSVPILLIAIGTFQRPTLAAQHRPYHAYSDQQNTPPPLPPL